MTKRECRQCGASIPEGTEYVDNDARPFCDRVCATEFEDAEDRGERPGFEPLPLADESCPECKGYGYDTFQVDDGNHAPVELQVVGDCDCACLDRRMERHIGSECEDGQAAIAFVRDLEAGRAHALRCARELIEAHTEDHGVGFDVYKSTEDGATVVHIDTEGLECDETGPTPLRVYVNDDTDWPVYQNPPYPGTAEKEDQE